jgi:hypothetical protein
MTSAPRSSPTVLFLELNEAEAYWIDGLAAAGKLPVFARMLAGGARVRTRIPGFDPAAPRAWRSITPWIVWPSVYTGLAPAEHGIVAFGQDTSPIRGRCLWDVLDRAGVSTGVFGSLLSYPPRNAGHAAFYVPETLADDDDCFPPEARAAQAFAVFSSRHYSESFLGQAVEGTALLLRSMASGVRPATVARTLAQIPRELLFGDAQVPERAMLQASLLTDAFRRLHARRRPAFSTLHLNNVAYMQHRYWRAAEPDRFRDELSATDRRFFSTVAERRAYEARFAGWIEKSLVWTDRLLGELLELVGDDGVLLVGTALGQRPHDPVHEIHNPVVRLVREDELFAALGLPPARILTQMNPDVSMTFADEAAARQAAERVAGLHVHPDEPLFEVDRRGPQVFLELVMPKRRPGEPLPPIRHAAAGFSAPFERHVHEHPTNDQSTAQHDEPGFLLAYSASRRLEAARASMAVTEIAPMLLGWYGVPPAPWMTAEAEPAIRVS